MTKPITNSFTLNPISSDTLTILKAYKKPMWAISILMWILIFVLNVFFAWAFFGNTFNDQMKDKLGIYIYLNDVASSENDAIRIKTSLEEKWIKVSYTSKDDALSFVEKRVPDLTDTFKKYNMDNPLPSTLYINYSNQEEFAIVKEVLEANKTKILNLSDVSDNAIKTQEKRVLTVINLSNFLQHFAYFVVLSILLTVIAFAIFFLRTIFSNFYWDIQAKKLLWASASQIIQPFLNVILIALIVAFIVAILLLIITSIPLNSYLMALLDANLFAYISVMSLKIAAVWLIEVAFIVSLLMCISYRYVWTLHSKLK